MNMQFYLVLISSEVIKGLPTASVLSSKTPKTSMKISKLFEKSKFRTYFNNDIIGTQIGGAMKNVIAIACGLIQGRKLEIMLGIYNYSRFI